MALGNKLFLKEIYTFEQAMCLVEGGGSDDSGKPKDIFMSGIFIQGGVRNYNRRIYPIEEIKKAVDQINECLNRGESVLGEADHPEDLNINLDRVSHMITRMYLDGPNGMGKLKILPTPMGNIIRTLLENGVKLGVSSRGNGDWDKTNGYISDYEMVTIDIVAKPSAPDAYPRAVYETLNLRRRGPIVEDLAIAVQHDPKAQEFLAKELLEWINNLKS